MEVDKADYSVRPMAGEGEDQVIEPFHPLYNPLILKKVIGFLDLDGLKKARTLSSLWNFHAWKELKDLSCVSLSHQDDMFERFLDHVQADYADPSQVPYHHYRLHHLNLTQRNHEMTRAKEFWLRLGPQVKTLHLNSCMVESGLLGRILSAQWTPNMETLILDECSYLTLDHSDLTSSNNRVRRLTIRSSKGLYNPPFDFRHIWTLFPQLEDLVLTDLTQEQSGSILKAAVAHRNTTGTPLQLTGLNIFGPAKFTSREVFLPNLMLLCSTGFPLARLHIDIGVSLRDPDLRLLIHSFSSTLESLVLWRGFVGDRLTGFPYSRPLPRLRTLEIPDTCVEDFEFIRYAPALRSLTVLQCDPEPMPYWTDMFKGKGSLRRGGDRELKPRPDLKELRIEFVISAEDVGFLREIFPNLAKLSAFPADSPEIRHSYF